MRKHGWKFAGVLVVALSWSSAALPQSPSPDTLAAAKELIIASNAADQIKTFVPLMMQKMKPAIVQNRPQVERTYDAIMPLMLEAMREHLDTFVEALAIVYARNFTADELREITVFYRRPVGQKLLNKLPVVMQETMVLGQKFGEAIGRDLEDKMVKELRKRGHDI